MTISEMAHIIGKSMRGPRCDSPMGASERDAYENAVLLCPGCHRLVDNRKLAAQYPAATLHRWKAEREREVRDATGVPEFGTRPEALEEIRQLLRENRAIFTAVGPGGRQFDDPRSPATTQWRRQLRERIVPNNWKVIAIGKRNRLHLTEGELQALAELSVHADALAYNALTTHPRQGAPLYPQAMKREFG